VQEPWDNEGPEQPAISEPGVEGGVKVVETLGRKKRSGGLLARAGGGKPEQILHNGPERFPAWPASYQQREVTREKKRENTQSRAAGERRKKKPQPYKYRIKGSIRYRLPNHS